MGWTKRWARRCTMFSWAGGVLFMLPFTQLLLQRTNNFAGGRWTRGSRRNLDRNICWRCDRQKHRTDRNICWRCDRQKHRTVHIQGVCLVHVQGPWCHVLSVCMWVLLVYRGMDSLEKRNKLHQKLVEKLVRTHTNLVLRESLDDVLHFLLPWDIEFLIDEPVDEPEEEPEV